MNNIKSFKVIGVVLTVIGAIVSIGSGLVSEKLLDAKLDEKIAEQVSKLNQK